jgi:hypothetical protein
VTMPGIRVVAIDKVAQHRPPRVARAQSSSGGGDNGGVAVPGKPRRS